MADYKSDKLPQLYSVFLGDVAAIHPYGVFIQIPGCGRKNGLVHKSQMSSTKIEDPEEMVTMGESVYCKVISIDDDGKVGLSMKLVNQTTGKDTDPNHVQIALDQQRRKTAHVREIKGIHLGAVFDTTCKKCGGKGHLAQDCFHAPGSEKYDLLPDVHFMMQEESQVKENAPDHKSKKKHKKEKKKHKKKRHVSSSDSEEERKKKSKKKKKKKSRRASSSDSSSESDSDEDRHKHVSKNSKERIRGAEIHRQSFFKSSDRTEHSTRDRSPIRERRGSDRDKFKDRKYDRDDSHRDRGNRESSRDNRDSSVGGRDRSGRDDSRRRSREYDH